MSERVGAGAALVGAIALSLYSAACASSRAAPRPFPMPAPPAAREPAATAAPPAALPDPGAPGTETSAVVRTAMELRGAPYRNGGSDLRGFDCSGFTQYVFAQAGTRLPRETREQFLLGVPVPVSEVRPGDLIFFTTTTTGPSHVGIALGGERFVHAPSSRGVVRIESLSLAYWSRRLVGVRRISAN